MGIEYLVEDLGDSHKHFDWQTLFSGGLLFLQFCKK
jgi:hypothetical protein